MRAMIRRGTIGAVGAVISHPAGALLMATAIALAATPVTAHAQADGVGDNQFLDLDLADLLSLEVTSVSRRPESLREAAAAVLVLTSEDIRRSGATNLPDLLRHVPGMNVAQINSSAWAVSARGFNTAYANKLLVLIDGRSIYSPLYGGVEWELHDLNLDDIDRIEIIRGPGSSVWGANAVNGVINVVTRNAAETQGNVLNVAVGDEDRATSAFRHGGLVGDRGAYRFYAKSSVRGSSSLESGEAAYDEWETARMGFRVDLMGGDDSALTLQGDMFDSRIDRISALRSFTAPYLSVIEDTDESSGQNILARWSRAIAGGNDLSVQAYYDRVERNPAFLRQKIETLDVDAQYHFQRAGRYDVVAGLAYRSMDDEFSGTFGLSIEPPRRSLSVVSGFVQGEMTLVPERLQLTLGTKLEHNDYTGLEVQPTVRLQWLPDDRKTIWGAVSRAVHTPSRFERESVLSSVTPAFPVPVVTRVFGDEGVRSEELLAYEIGYRTERAGHFFLDVTAFYNDYKNLLGSRLETPSCQPSGTPPPCFVPGDTHFLLPIAFASTLAADTHGFELEAEWQPSERWRLTTSYSYLRMDMISTDGLDRALLAEGESPSHQISVGLSSDIGADTEFDIRLRYVDELPAQAVSAYTTLDFRLAWNLSPQVEVSFVGRNLLDDRHAEFLMDAGRFLSTQVERSAYAGIEWAF